MEPQSSKGEVLAHWDAKAKEFKSSDLATNPDPHYRALEIESIIRVLKAMKPERLLDVGCGNGYTTRAIAKHFPAATVSGVDFSEAMIAEAAKYIGPNEEYCVGDVLSLSRNKKLDIDHYDVVLSSRCLINLANWEEQKVGILEMRKMVAPGGHLVLVENVQDGLDNLNALRKGLGLETIKPPWHNKYLPQSEITTFFGDLQQGNLLLTEYVENIGNFYYLASRVLYAKLCKDQGVEPDYNNPINAVAAKMPTLGEHYACSPNFMFVLKREEGLLGWANKKISS